MSTIKELSKYTNSLQSMMIMDSTEKIKPAVGLYLTRFLYTDRRSKLIVKVDGNTFYTEDEMDYYYSEKRGVQGITWEGKKWMMKDHRITKTDLTYTDPSF